MIPQYVNNKNAYDYAMPVMSHNSIYTLINSGDSLQLEIVSQINRKIVIMLDGIMNMMKISETGEKMCNFA